MDYNGPFNLLSGKFVDFHMFDINSKPFSRAYLCYSPLYSQRWQLRINGKCMDLIVITFDFNWWLRWDIVWWRDFMHSKRHRNGRFPFMWKKKLVVRTIAYVQGDDTSVAWVWEHVAHVRLCKWMLAYLKAKLTPNCRWGSGVAVVSTWVMHPVGIWM